MRERRHRLPRAGTGLRRTLMRCGVAAVSAVVLVATALGWYSVHGMLGGINVSSALGADSPRSSGGEMNILLIGLDSRKDQQGNDLPREVLDQLHAGDSDTGGYNTNTLILVHVGADDKVVAFSIPRDDYIPFTGVPYYQHIKIKEAYGLTKAYTEQKLADKGITDQEELENQGREAGRKATLKAVRDSDGRADRLLRRGQPGQLLRPHRRPRRRRGVPESRCPRRLFGSRLPGRRQTLNAAQALASSGSATAWRTATSTGRTANRRSSFP